MGLFNRRPLSEKEKEFGRQCICGHYKMDHPNLDRRGSHMFTQHSLIPEHFIFAKLGKDAYKEPCVLCNCKKYNKKK